VLARETAEAALRAAITACDPAPRVLRRLATARAPHGTHRPGDVPRIYGLAIGKAALAMARGVPQVARGIAIAPVDDGRLLPAGWRLILGSHPEPDARSLAAGDAAVALVDEVGEADLLIALISGGASALCERPTVPLAELRARIAALVAAGAPIAEVNAARTALSELKGGKLAARCRGQVLTLIASDVVGDDPRTIGSGPTVGRPTDAVEVISPMRCFAEALAAELAIPVLDPPITGDVEAVAARLATTPPPFVAWGEPTLVLPAQHGRGGRAQHLALLLARALQGTLWSALVAASDGVDGPPPTAAGAFVDGSTWARLSDPATALATCDSAVALHREVVHTGPTGINHGDVVVIA